MSKLAVKEMPAALASAARGQGRSDDHEMTLQEALRCWAEWEIGDPQFATDILRLADEFRTDLQEKANG